MTPEVFVRQVARMTIEGECLQCHSMNTTSLGNAAEGVCLDCGGPVYSPPDTNDEADALYALIAEAREIIRQANL